MTELEITERVIGKPNSNVLCSNGVLEGNATMHTNIEIESRHFNIDGWMDKKEKLALLCFAANEFDLKQFLALPGCNPNIAAQFILQQFSSQNTKIDLLYLDLADLPNLAPVAQHLKLMARGGIVCIDGAPDGDILNEIRRDKLEPILETADFSIFARSDGERPIRSMHYEIDLFRRKYFFETIRLSRSTTINLLPLVVVVVLAYRHEQYIAECLNSILIQKGNFRMRVIILDDASTDRTAELASIVIAGQSNDRIEFDFRCHPNNIGMVKNFGESIRLAAGCDYLTFCEGDDFWSADTRIQEHIDFLAAHPECVMSFNTIERCLADGSARKIFSDHANNPHLVIDGKILAANNLPGNLAACFYYGALVEIIPEEMFDLYAGDWLFNMYCAQFGGVGHLKKPLSVYRQHVGGIWSGETKDKIDKTWKLVEEYNNFLDYQYDEGFQEYKKRLLFHWGNDCPVETGKFDLLILDNIFPSSRSGFSLEEFTSYLSEFPKAMVLASGLALSVLGDRPLNDVARKFQRKNPKLANRVVTTGGDFPIQLFKLLYVHFLSKAYALLPLAEAKKTPFVFTLYPGSGFVLNNPECDHKLKRVFDSPCFLKVIVTQKITYDYIVGRNLCPIDKVEMIFGVVMPQEAFFELSTNYKLRWGFGKTRLDICFMAHRYTQYGEDKGYDVFVNLASMLCKLHDDIYFHVVGPYDHRVIDVSAFRDRIVFRGSLDPEQFDDFFKDMDLIMSPNISGKIFPGSFDGFPTASCTEAGLRGTAIFACDEFSSGEGRFTDGQDIVLINYDLEHIVNKVEEYYRNPAELKAIGERGRRRILDLYSYESQMKPRIRMLQELISTPFVFHPMSIQKPEPSIAGNVDDKRNAFSRVERSRVWKMLRKYSPELLRRFYRSYIKSHIS
jgi:glycosyltransferase involved in cell wall biosynthesis